MILRGGGGRGGMGRGRVGAGSGVAGVAIGARRGRRGARGSAAGPRRRVLVRVRVMVRQPRTGLVFGTAYC